MKLNDKAVKLKHTKDRIDLYNNILSNNNIEMGMKDIENGVTSFYDGERCIIQIREGNSCRPTVTETYITEYFDDDSGHNFILGATQMTNFKGVVGYNAFEMDTFDDKISFLPSIDSEHKYSELFNETMNIVGKAILQRTQENIESQDMTE